MSTDTALHACKSTASAAQGTLVSETHTHVSQPACTCSPLCSAPASGTSCGGATASLHHCNVPNADHTSMPDGSAASSSWHWQHQWCRQHAEFSRRKQNRRHQPLRAMHNEIFLARLMLRWACACRGKQPLCYGRFTQTISTGKLAATDQIQKSTCNPVPFPCPRTAVQCNLRTPSSLPAAACALHFTMNNHFFS